MRRVTIFVALTALLVAVPVYFRLGWTRMVNECDFGGPLASKRLAQVPLDSGGSREVHFSWEWPGGFTCNYSNGNVRQSYWF